MLKNDPFSRCYVCDNWVGASGERDHFPRSFAEGGELVLPICASCHDIKDRIGLERWSPEESFAAMSGLWGKATTQERLMIVKMFHVASMVAPK